MSEEKKYDDETQKFYDENKEMIDKILAMHRESGSEKSRVEEMLRREAFEKRMRMEYEAEKARREAFDKSEKAYSDLMYGRERTESALEEARDHAIEYSRKQREYFMDDLMQEADRFRESLDRGREYAKDRYEADRNRMKESCETARKVVNDGFDEVFSPLADTQFQRHVVGAGLELWMALNALVKAAPFPDSVKDAFQTADMNKNAEFCAKNQQCGRRSGAAEDPEKKEDQPRQIKIQPLNKENSQ